MKRALLAALLLAASCATPQQRTEYLRGEVAKATNCTDVEVQPTTTSPYPAKACGGREYMCQSVRLSEFNWETQCDETPQSRDGVMQRIALERVSMESECPREKVQMEELSNWTVGTERAYRFNACGVKYFCTTANGRADCKAKASPASMPSE